MQYLLIVESEKLMPSLASSAWIPSAIREAVDRPLTSKIAKDGHIGYCACMISPALNVNLTAELRRYVKEQVRSGRYQNENEVVRDAIRQMQEREMEQFNRVFGNFPGAPRGEPTDEDHAAIKAAVQRHRNGRRTAQTA